MAIKKIMDQNSKYRHRCIRCGGSGLPRLVEGRKVKCPHCGCVHIPHFTDNGNLVLIDAEYEERFSDGKMNMEVQMKHREEPKEE